MRLGILSDTHDEWERTQLAVRMLQAAGVDALFHCGDITEPSMLAAFAGLQSYFVFGNHDADNVPHLRQAAAETGVACLGWGGIVTLGGKRMGIVHGHLSSDLCRVMAERPDYLFSGHSHLVHDRREGVTRRINPGALFEADEFTVELLDVETDDLRILTVSSQEAEGGP
jgi:putative phosphoesterase